MRLEAVDALALKLAVGTAVFLHPNVRTLLLQYFQPLLLNAVKTNGSEDDSQNGGLGVNRTIPTK
jgi:hypothetical protein